MQGAVGAFEPREQGTVAQDLGGTRADEESAVVLELLLEGLEDVVSK